jgi:hypothetical protein
MVSVEYLHFVGLDRFVQRHFKLLLAVGIVELSFSVFEVKIYSLN